MIVRMNKYTFVVLARQREEFLERLQELGMVDVTTAGWEPSEDDRALMSLIDRHSEAGEYLSAFAKTTEFEPGKPYETGAAAFEEYSSARKALAAVEPDIARYEKMADEVRPWGNYNPEHLRELMAHGVSLETLFEATGIDPAGQEMKLPEMSLAEVEAKLAGLNAERKGWNEVLARAAASVHAIEADGEHLKERLQFRQAAVSGEEAAEGSLVVMEAWAREKQEAEVDAMLEVHPDVLYIKEKPTPEDETPVELHNTPVSRPFEFIAEMYALPRYGTMDLTRWFAPFYMLFFGFCLADAGYGLLILLGGVFLALKGKGAMKSIGKLSVYCGAAAVVFGFFAGSMFGIDIKAWGVFAGSQKMFLTSNGMFIMALALGVFQILFGMVLKVITTIRAFGLKYALATIGWIIVILTGIVMIVPGQAGFSTGIPDVALYATLGVGLFMMLFMNNPGKNPLVNFGGGLWNTYNDITGFLSDALSYIRLFAIGLSGGVLATVFNDLAFGLSPDIPVLGQLVTLIILLIGHGLNLFMSTLSSMVHPLRLTFVEFYKNAGFEASTRVFNPLKQSKRTNNK